MLSILVYTNTQVYVYVYSGTSVDSLMTKLSGKICTSYGECTFRFGQPLALTYFLNVHPLASLQVLGSPNVQIQLN